MVDYFQKTPLDADFYSKYLEGGLPKTFIDAHAHFNLPEHVCAITAETIAGDWALECGLTMSCEDASAYYAALFPGKEVLPIALPMPLRDADTAANNAYIAELIAARHIGGLYTMRPEYDAAQVKEDFLAGGFCGFKPYPYMAAAAKGAEVSIFEFMPAPFWELADELAVPVLMHLPRAGRLPDPDNISEIRTILSKYPNARLVIAHFGRCFCHEHFQDALDILGEDAHRLWFDTAAVINPRVYDIAFRRLHSDRIIFGTDFPILLWHGKRLWENGKYINLCREDFSWNPHSRRDEEEGYTFFVYEQLKSILDAAANDKDLLRSVFYGNAAQTYLGK